MIATSIRAAQLVFTRVEPAYSPKAREGYQIVWSSPSLVAEVVAEIESRIRCFVPAQGRERRLQFSALRAGGYFVARTEQIRTNRSICDRHGRPGFLVQAGWVKEEEFAKLGYDPFPLLAAFPSDVEIDDLVATFGRATGVATELDIEVGEGDYEGLTTGASIERTAALALTGEILAFADPPVSSRFFLRGENSNVESVLRMVHAFLPSHLRRICSFDTHIDGCLLADATYLFLAGQRLPSSRPLQIIEVLAPPTMSMTDNVSEMFLGWLTRRLALNRPEAIAKQTETAYQVALVLCGRKAATNAGELNKEVCRELLEDHGELLRRRLAACMSPWLERRFIDDYFKWVLDDQIQTAPEELVAELIKGNSSHQADGVRRAHSRWEGLKRALRPRRTPAKENEQ
jgi:hypothetical protein